MIVKLAKHSGFCFGVKRAINIAMEASEEYKEVVTLGSIIHNPQMVKKLEREHVFKVSSVEEIDGRPTLIRSHGIKKEDYETLKKKNIKIIDATCPYVSKAQENAAKLSSDGYFVVIMGDRSHPEVIAIRSYIAGESMVVETADELDFPKKRKIALISQTTKNLENFQNIAETLVPKCDELRVINTICSATTVRQNATLELAKNSDLMIVIGGKNSSNTKMLAKICTKFIETHHIETETELDEIWFENKEKIGLSAGASTPDWIIVNVYNKIMKSLGKTCEEVRQVDEIPGFLGGKK